jgi:hypothetical protein
MGANHIICPNHGFAIAGRIRQISKAVLRIEQGRSRACARTATATCPATCHLWGARVDDRDISGYFPRQVIATTPVFVRVRARGSIPVSVRTLLVRKLLVGGEGKVVSQNFTSWNRIGEWLMRLDVLRRAPERARVACARAAALARGVSRDESR